jgi:hypothetical protein
MKHEPTSSDDVSLGAGMIFDRSPLYAVLFSTKVDLSQHHLPITAAPLDSEWVGTVPHALDRDVATALPGLWYCLHLPNTFQQLVDIPAMSLKAEQALHLDHQILLVPIQGFNNKIIPAWHSWMAPTLVICPDDLLEDAAPRATDMGFPLPTVSYSQLSDESLKAHWRAIHDHFVSEAPYLGREPELTQRLDLAPIDLPRRWLSRQMTDDASIIAPSNDSPDHIMRTVLGDQLQLGTVARLEFENTPPEVAAEKLPNALKEEVPRLRFPLALGLPGVAPAYIREVYTPAMRKIIKSITRTEEKDTWSAEVANRTDNLIERAAIEFATTHQALARSGAGLTFGSIPREAFIVLAQLERHFHEGPYPATVWRLLDRLDKAAESIWNDAAVLSIRQASMISAFTNFPIGLLRFPTDTTSLTNRVPITYRPLIPLTRTLQRELMHIPPIEFHSQFHVLVAECIPDDDPVGRESRSGWQFVENMIKSQSSDITIEIVEALSIDALRRAIVDSKPDILVISAHGHFERERNMAGLVIGSEFYMGPEIDTLPPVVILSACNVAPKGAGAVTITDLLLREGAVAVLGTQVPVDVRHNSMLMMRFFLYMTEALKGREQHSNLLEVWHHVQMSNAINDILDGETSLHSWGMSNGPSGLPVLTEFMRLRAPGRLRWGHIYQDTEAVLGEIADEQGMGEMVRNWFKAPGYVPESLFYVFNGRPERIYLKPLNETALKVVSPESNIAPKQVRSD